VKLAATLIGIVVCVSVWTALDSVGVHSHLTPGLGVGFGFGAGTAAGRWLRKRRESQQWTSDRWRNER
jgi:hypothetical protein